jgi:hypothetical protein
MAQIIHDIDVPNSGNGDELRTAFGNQNTMNTELYTTKVDKVTGKALSTNDFTNDEKAKLAGIEAGAQVNVPINFNDLVDAPEQLFASVGYFDHNDLATHTTPISFTSGPLVKLTNDTLGAYTDLSKAPYGVTDVWDSSTNYFDFSQMDVGDTIDLRVDLDVTTTGTNKTLKMFIKFGIGTPSAFLKFIDSFEFKTSVTNENVTANIPFYLGSEDIKNAPAELYILADTSGSLKVNGWYTRIIRKSINIVDVRPYKIYSAIITQIGTDAPTATVLENSFDDVFTISYVSQGIYNITNSEITENCFTTINNIYYDFSAGVNPIKTASLQPLNGSAQIVTMSDGVLSNNVLYASIEIRLYN